MQLQPISALYRYPFYTTRAEYEARTGKPAPPLDPTRLVQNWEAPDTDQDPSVFKVWDPGSPTTGYVSLLAIPRSQARSPNLPDQASAAAALPIPINPPPQGYQIVLLNHVWVVQFTGMLSNMLYPQLLPNGSPDFNPTHGIRNELALEDYLKTGIYNLGRWDLVADEKIWAMYQSSEATVGIPVGALPVPFRANSTPGQTKRGV